MSPTCTPASARAALLRQTRHQNDRAEAGSPGLGTSIQSAPFQWIANVRYPESTPLFLWYPTDPISSAACAFIPKTLLKVVRSVDDLPGSALGVRWSGSDGYRQKSDKGGKLYIILAAPSAIDIRLSLWSGAQCLVDQHAHRPSPKAGGNHLGQAIAIEVHRHQSRRFVADGEGSAGIREMAGAIVERHVHARANVDRSNHVRIPSPLARPLDPRPSPSL